MIAQNDSIGALGRLEVTLRGWSGTRVLVTGHTGFKGSWLCLWLEALGAKITGLALPPATDPNLFEISEIGSRMDSRIVDLRDAEAVKNVMTAADPEFVFHLGAQAIVRTSYDQPLETFQTNVLGTADVLEAARGQDRLRALVVITSDKVYLPATEPRVEDSLLGGRDPYSASKAAAEMATNAWRASFPQSARIATARAGNVVGGGDWAADRLIPDLVRAADGKPLRIRYPSATRPWQHVLECSLGYLLLAQHLVGGTEPIVETLNFGPGQDSVVSVEEVLRIASRHWPMARWEAEPGPHPYESPALALDSSRAEEVLGWRPALSLDETIGWTMDWYAGVRAGKDARALCLDQIERFTALIDGGSE